MLCSLRPRMVCFAALCAIAAMGTIACGPNANNGDGGGSITPNEMEERLVQLIGDTQCERFYQCPEEQRPGEVLFASRFGSEQACKNNIQTLFGTEFESTLQRDIDAGLSEFDGEKALECIEAIENSSEGPCTNLGELFDVEPEACVEALKGTQPVGAACDGDDHCQSGYCDFSAETTEVCWSGECGENKPEEVLLDEGADCGTLDGICDPTKNLTCDTATDEQGLICVQFDSRAEGDACSDSDVCQPGLACIENTCATTNLAAQGEACDLRDVFCQPGLVCVTQSFDQSGLQGSCEPPLTQGTECYLDVACESGLQCDGASFETQTPGTCEPTLPEGSECDGDIDCQDGLRCESPQDCDPGSCGPDVCTAQDQEQDPYCEVPTEMMGS